MNHKERIVWTLFAVGLLLIPLAFWKTDAAKFHEKNYPAYGNLPSFSLIDQNQKPFVSADLRGKVWVANFIFTSCANTCPRLTKKMLEVQEFVEKERLSDVRLVSISVDPSVDKPEKLKAYAKEYGANESIWSFLSGEDAAIREIIVKGFHVAVGEREQKSEFFDIVHGNRFVLVDAAGQIRGYYDVEETDREAKAGMASLKKDLKSFQKGVTVAKASRVK